FHKGEVAQAHILHNLGYREFKCRGNEKCENEMNLFSTAYNLIKIYKKWKERRGNLEASIKNIFVQKFIFILKEL
ncbi:MAG: transposase, partial [Nanoarchaeota archaeon]|nr:transposase [Nanoarchaeota archaeon]